MRSLKSLVLAVSVPAVILLAGCQSGGAKAASADAMSTKGVMCSKCQVTYVQLPNSQKNRVVGYSTRKSMECPECKSAAENFFATGKLEHTCKLCGDSMAVCESH